MLKPVYNASRVSTGSFSSSYCLPPDGPHHPILALQVLTFRTMLVHESRLCLYISSGNVTFTYCNPDVLVAALGYRVGLGGSADKTELVISEKTEKD